MNGNRYHLQSSWRVRAEQADVYAVLADSAALARWWPAAFVEVLELEPGDDSGVGRIVRLKTRGWLPYMLRWHLKVEEVDPPHGFSFRVWGDFEGRGAWSLRQDELWTAVDYDWRVEVKKGIVRYLSFLARPVFVANHRWAMKRGDESLEIELARRGANGIEVGPPPSAPKHSGKLVLAALAAAAGFMLLRRTSADDSSPASE